MLLLCACFLLAESPSGRTNRVSAFTAPLLMGAARCTTLNGKASKSLSRKIPSNSRRKNRNSTTNNGSQNKNQKPKPKPKNLPSASNPPAKANPKSLGEAVQLAQTIPELLDVAARFWLPTDADLPSHLRTQSLHHERRQRWGAQLLSKLGAASLYSSSTIDTIWQDKRFARAVLAVALPFPSENAPLPKTSDKDSRTLREALIGLHTLVGPMEGQQLTSLLLSLAHTEDLYHGIQVMIERAEANANQFILPEAIEVRWAARGLVAQLGSSVAPNHNINSEEESAKDDLSSLQQYLTTAFPQLEERVKGLPFDILPMGVDFSNLKHWPEGNDGLENQADIMTSLRQSIPFKYDTIVTRHGDSVTERRGTAWVAEEGIGALAYSGKLMPPSPMPPLVRCLMEQVESAVEAPTENFFDCALCNYYPEGDAACKFHTDPEHGTMWERLTAVVSVGDSRRFAFRPIPDQSAWSDWDNSDVTTTETGNIPAVIRLFPGDIVSMWADCNDSFHHAVYPESETATSPRDASELRRVSLVLKRAIAYGSGRRGHGLAGAGRRSRRQKIEL